MLLLVRLVGKVVGEIPLADEQGGAAVARNNDLSLPISIGFVVELIKAQDIVFLTEALFKKTTPLAFVDGGYYNYYKRKVLYAFIAYARIGNI